ncbi:MAG: sigma-70 family RNA polymerase sigma factor, partial [Myxococcota bacterium]
MAEDLELFEAWADGDSRAGSQLFDRHGTSILAFFRNKVGDTAAEDLVQETFLACLRARESFRGDASFRTYLFRAARNRLINYFTRDRPRQEAVDFGVTSIADLGGSPSSVLAQAEQHQLLVRSLVRLPLELQIAVELHYFEKMTTAEVGQVLEIPTGTVRSRLRRARA